MPDVNKLSIDCWDITAITESSSKVLEEIYEFTTATTTLEQFEMQ